MATVSKKTTVSTRMTRLAPKNNPLASVRVTRARANAVAVKLNLIDSENPPKLGSKKQNVVDHEDRKMQTKTTAKPTFAVPTLKPLRSSTRDQKLKVNRKKGSNGDEFNLDRSTVVATSTPCKRASMRIPLSPIQSVAKQRLNGALPNFDLSVYEFSPDVTETNVPRWSSRRSERAFDLVATNYQMMEKPETVEVAKPFTGNKPSGARAMRSKTPSVNKVATSYPETPNSNSVVNISGRTGNVSRRAVFPTSEQVATNPDEKDSNAISTDLNASIIEPLILTSGSVAIIPGRETVTSSLLNNTFGTSAIISCKTDVPFSPLDVISGSVNPISGRKIVTSSPLECTFVPDRGQSPEASFLLSSPITYSRSINNSSDRSGFADGEEEDGVEGSSQGDDSGPPMQLFDLRDLISVEHETRFNRARALVLEPDSALAVASDDEMADNFEEAPKKKKTKKTRTKAATKNRSGEQPDEGDGLNRWIQKMVAEFEEIDNMQLCVSE